MSLFEGVNLLRKIIVGGVAGGAVGVPTVFAILAGGGTRPEGISLGTGRNSTGLTLTSTQLLNPKSTEGPKTFNDVKMKWFDGYELKPADTLYSPFQDGKYYLAKAVGGKYELEGGERVPLLRWWYFKDKNYKFVELKWNSWYSVGSSIRSITVGSCTFKTDGGEVGKRKITMICSTFLNQKIPQDRVTTTFNELDYHKK